MEEEFIKAVDIILPAMRNNRKIYEFVIEYLIGGFDQFGFTKVMTHVASQSIIDESCENDDLKHRIETLKLLAPGNKAPEIIFENSSLYSIDKKYTLVLFYASWCPHCSELLPELKTFYQNRKNDLEIFSISIDTTRADYQNHLKQYNFEWVNNCDFKGWDTQSANDYGVYVTPNLFLLDENKLVIARPSGMEELKELIK
jgi:thiol-disulfide isomerase/thioredoxin